MDQVTRLEREGDRLSGRARGTERRLRNPAQARAGWCRSTARSNQANVASQGLLERIDCTASGHRPSGQRGGHDRTLRGAVDERRRVHQPPRGPARRPRLRRRARHPIASTSPGGRTTRPGGARRVVAVEFLPKPR